MTLRVDRAAAVAGRFYPGEPLPLERAVRAFLDQGAQSSPLNAVALVVPHAGFPYSGHVAGATYARVRIPERVVVLAVNHYGRGADVASWAGGSWRTPLGAVPVDAEMVAAIARHAGFVRHDPRAHEDEHSLEVQLPFLQVAAPAGLRIAPISIATQDLPRLEALGAAVAAAVQEASEPVLIVSSTDMSHYVDLMTARALDELALERIEALDGPGLHRIVNEKGISMCGVAPTTAALIAARALGATRVERVRYATSGDVTGDDTSVVGYAGLAIS